MSKGNINLKDLDLTDFEDLVAGLGHARYRGRQLARWIFSRGAATFEEMTDLPPDLRASLANMAWTGSLAVERRQATRQGDVVKYLLVLPDGQRIETVLMHYSYGRSVCVSTQAGCRMGCRLCASGIGGLVRNLTAGEIYDQLMAIQREECCRVSHVVLMGCGEPLDNLDHVLRFMEHLTADYGLGISYRRITVSTCGLVPGIRELAARRLPVTLAVSLHAANDCLRDEIVPVNRKYPLAVLLEACRDYINLTGRRVTFEYALWADINDSQAQARELVGLIKGMNGHVNLIPANPVPERDVRPSSPRRVQEFRQILEAQGLTVTVRRKLGADIEAACGMLRRRAGGKGEQGGL